jgi:hypothetical protein
MVNNPSWAAEERFQQPAGNNAVLTKGLQELTQSTERDDCEA